MNLNLSNSILNYKCVFFLIQNMSEVDVVKNHFEVSDSNHDGQLDSREWLGYIRENLHSLKRDKKSRILRQNFFLKWSPFTTSNTETSIITSNVCQKIVYL